MAGKGNPKMKAKPDEHGPAHEFIGRLQRPAGRPSDYDPTYCEEVVNVMRAGFSLTAFCGIIGVVPQTVANWRKEHPEFDDACELAKASRLVHWEEASIQTGRGGGGPGSATMVQFALRNINSGEYPDKQRVENTGADGKPMEHRVSVVRRKIIRPGDIDPEASEE